MHPEEEIRGQVGETVREYREQFVPNANIIQAEPDEEQPSDSDISHYFEYLRDEEESDPEESDPEDANNEDEESSLDSQDPYRNRRILIRHPNMEDTDLSDNNDEESENDNGDPEDDDHEDEGSQDSDSEPRILIRHPDMENTSLSENDNENENENEDDSA